MRKLKKEKKQTGELRKFWFPKLERNIYAYSMCEAAKQANKIAEKLKK